MFYHVFYSTYAHVPIAQYALRTQCTESNFLFCIVKVLVNPTIVYMQYRSM